MKIALTNEEETFIRECIYKMYGTAVEIVDLRKEYTVSTGFRVTFAITGEEIGTKFYRLEEKFFG